VSKLTTNEVRAVNEQDVRPTIGVITALAHEYAAFKVLLESQRSIFVSGRGAGRQYLYGEVQAPNGGSHQVVLALLPDMGNDHASTRAALLLEHFPSVHTVIMSGIAGGVPNPDKPTEHVRLGDIVVSNREGVVQYDLGKEELVDGKVEFTPRHPPRPPSASLVETARILQAGELEGERPWVRHIERGVERLSAARPPAETDVLASSSNPDVVIPHPNDPRRVKDLPRVFLGSIASSNTLLKNPLKRDQLRDRFGVKAVEMEGSGIADAAWNVEVQYLVVRGVCDYCDRNKGDDWQMYAAVVAASYTKALLEATPADTSAYYSPEEGGSIRVAGDVDRSVIVSGSNNQITINAAPTEGTSPDMSHRVAVNVLSAQLESVSSELSDEKLDKLEELRELFREGEFNDAYEGVRQFRQSPNWNAMSEGLRAAVLRALAIMTLSFKKLDGIAEATRLADEARETEPSEDDATLRVRLKIFTEGHAPALEELASPTTLDGFNLRLGLLIETDRIEEALEALRNPPAGVAFDAETQRLYALALLASKDLQGAREHISLALAERPRRLYIRFNAAIIDYFSALSSLAVPPRLIPYPRPIPLSMVKGDVDSRERILRAAEEFKHVAEISTPRSDELKTVEAWHVACLSSLADLQPEATHLCKRRLADDPGDVRIIPWVLFHSYDIDLSASAETLRQSLDRSGEHDSAELEKLVALLGIYLKRGSHREALDLLEKERSAFGSADELDLWRYWRSQILIADGQAELALEESSRIEDQPLQRAAEPLPSAASPTVAAIGYP
jgi:nucleoside phosphorylase/tetratricopeptide (TPR) repeat protein